MTQTETPTERLERDYLNALRLQVERQAAALDGLVTREKQRALSSAMNVTNNAQKVLLTRYMEEMQTSPPSTRGDDIDPDAPSEGEAYHDSEGAEVPFDA